MHIYLVKGEIKESDYTFKLDKIEPCRYQYGDRHTIWDFGTTPYLTEIKLPFDLVENFVRPELFLKATHLETQMITTASRTCGVYEYGKARAEIMRGKQQWEVTMRLETSSPDGLKDMEILRELIWSGAISPVLSYEEKQGNQSLLNVVKYVLGKQKLSWLQRIVMCWKLTRA
jgi:hypothetical protein